MNDTITGIFVEETKNRFLCTVEINGCVEKCHISSSCRLENFVSLAGKEVVLSKIQSQNASARYTVMAIKHKHSYIILNPSLANTAIRSCIHNRRFAFLGKRSEIKKECKINDYKSDFYIPSQKRIIEVKSVISFNEVIAFPTVYSERAIKQLDSISALLKDGYKASYIIVSLNPYAKTLEINKATKLFEKLSMCMEDGLELKCMKCNLLDMEPVIIGSIPIII